MYLLLLTLPEVGSPHLMRQNPNTGGVDRLQPGRIKADLYQELQREFNAGRSIGATLYLDERRSVLLCGEVTGEGEKSCITWGDYNCEKKEGFDGNIPARNLSQIEELAKKYGVEIGVVKASEKMMLTRMWAGSWTAS